MLHLRCLGLGVLFGLLTYTITAHGADGSTVSSIPAPSVPVGPGAWPAFASSLGAVLGVVIGRAGGIPIVWITKVDKP